MASPVLAPPEVRDVTLALFGGRKTDIAPSDCPEGLTPDEQDNIFLPGDVQSRPGLERLYTPGNLTAGTSILYQKTYMQPNDQPLTLVLTSDGKLWAENVVSSPGVPVQIGTVPAGTYGHSVTEFGREYLAFSDLLHGQGIPLQFDGTNLDRVTMDGPGAPPLAADENLTISIANSPNGLNQLAGGALNVNSGVELGTQITLILTGFTPTNAAQIAKSFQANDQWQIAGVGAGWNGTFPVQSCVNLSTGVTGKLRISYTTTVSGLVPVGAGGTAAHAYYAVTDLAPTTTVPAVGNSVTIAGAGVGGYNTTSPVRLLLGNPGQFAIYITGQFALANSGGGTWTIAGSVSVGQHQVVVMFLTRQGYITAPSPPFSWSAAGGKRAVFSNLPIGPSNVVARIIGLTAAGGANYFIIPATYTLPGTTTIVYATVIPDNTSTSATIDFSDNALLAGIAIDQIGNDLFDQAVLGPVLGFFAFASRLTCWGDYNKVENFLNTTFCGGYLSGVLTEPLGWDASQNAGGTLVNGGSWASGMAWQITGDGTANPKGQLNQTAYLTNLGTAILSANTQYSVRFWAKASAAGLNGTVTVQISSVSAAFTSTAQFLINTLSTLGALTPFVAFSLVLPNVIPSDLIISVFENNLNNAATLTISELEFIFTANPFRDNLSRWSYVNNPEAFALTTGNLGPDDDASPIRCFSLLRLSGILGSGEGVHTFVDNDQEPGTWNVSVLTRSLGVASLRGLDPGKYGTGDGAEDWLIVGSPNGAYLFAGADFWKISQEISRGTLPQSQDPRKTWNDINLAVQQTIVVKNDPLTRRAYCSVPLNGNSTPNGVFVLDYREMDTATQIAAAPPLHITIQGKMRSSDLTRKWSFWNVFANTIEILIRPGNVRQLFFGGGLNAGAQAFGNIYQLSKTKLTDDDYGQIFPYYTTYAFTDHEQEMGLQLGSGRKLTKAIHAFVTGVGLVSITPIVNSLYNFQPSLSQRVLVADTDRSNFLASDLEWTTGIHGQRVFYRISVNPLPGATDVQYRLQKFIAYMMKDPVAVSRQSMV